MHQIRAITISKTFKPIGIFIIKFPISNMIRNFNSSLLFSPHKFIKLNCNPFHIVWLFFHKKNSTILYCAIFYNFYYSKSKKHFPVSYPKLLYRHILKIFSTSSGFINHNCKVTVIRAFKICSQRLS